MRRVCQACGSTCWSKYAPTCFLCGSSFYACKLLKHYKISPREIFVLLVDDNFPGITHEVAEMTILIYRTPKIKH